MIITRIKDLRANHRMAVESSRRGDPGAYKRVRKIYLTAMDILIEHGLTRAQAEMLFSSLDKDNKTDESDEKGKK